MKKQTPAIQHMFQLIPAVYISEFDLNNYHNINAVSFN